MSFGKFFFTQASPLIRVARQRTISPQDALPLDRELDPEHSERRISHAFARSPLLMLWKLFISTSRPAYLTLAIAIGRIALLLAAPLLLQQLLQNFALLPHDQSLFSGSMLLGLLLAATIAADGLAVQHYYYNALKVYAQIIGGLNMRIYRHALQLKIRSLTTRHTGDIVNHMASDTEALGELSFVIPEITSSLLLIIGSFVVIWSLLGAAAIVALSMVALLVPITRAAARRFTRTDNELWSLRDHRVTLISQIISAMRLVKSFAWETSIEEEINQVRQRELRTAARLIRYEALATALFLATTTLVALSSFAAYALMGGTLSPSVIFPTLLALLYLEGPIGHLPHFIKNGTHAYVAATRLSGYFNEPTTHNSFESSSCSESPAISIENLHARYHNEQPYVLKNLSLDIQVGEAVAIVGHVGSGKSTLLLALLREVDTEGTITMTDHYGTPCESRIAYVAQEPFLLNATVRENISFGMPLSECELMSIIEDAALSVDISQFPAGYDTEIGERGVSISGGQKMRIALARAAARKPHLLLLDDPLAAVDLRTEAQLLDRLIFGRWHGTTRVVVTHRLTHVHRFDKIVVLRDGTIEAVGSFEHVYTESEYFRQLFAASYTGQPQHTLQEESPVNGSQSPSSDGKLVQEEDRAVGVVRADLFWYYLRQFGGATLHRSVAIAIAMIGLGIAIVAVPILQNLWLGWHSTGQPPHTLWLLSIYAALGLAALCAHYWQRRLWIERALIASAKIHRKMLQAVLRAPMKLFDTTPSGRILNRFARDIQSIDDELAWNFESALRSLVSMLGTLVLICVVAPLVLLIAAPALVFFYRIQRDYRRVAREVKRFESIARSPRYALFKETLHGLLTIRALRCQSYFSLRFTNAVRHYLQMYWSSVLLNRWFSTRAPLVSSAIAVVTVIFLVVLISKSDLSPGVAGVVLTYTMTFWGNLNWCVRAFSEVESRMTSLERVQALSNIEPEPETSCNPPLAPSQPWIDTDVRSSIAGVEVVFDHVWVRYGLHRPWVLRDVSFHIKPGMHVGVMGRTGSGKTTILNALFRFVEIERGRILLGGIEHCRIPLQRLRSAISFVPQDPILLLGTVRSNLDRWQRYDDRHIWEILEKVGLVETIDTLGGLDARIGEHGANLSQGQRQLLCLAQALLNHAHLIVLDEATASIDPLSDAAIHQTLSQHCNGVTVITVAHRQDSLVHSDMIIELSGGVVARQWIGSTEHAASQYS